MMEALSQSSGISTMGALRLRLVTFTCGMVLMALQMAGVRLLDPHFGSTIYVWGSIIVVFLGALSLGYALGGRIADRYPSIHILGWIAFLSALSIALIPFIAQALCNTLNAAEWLPVKYRALLGGLALYAVPSVLLGMVSPFVVRLAATKIKVMGSVAGSLYAISTLGSITGTILVSFVLTEFLGTKTIIWGLAASLLAVALTCASIRTQQEPQGPL